MVQKNGGDDIYGTSKPGKSAARPLPNKKQQARTKKEEGGARGGVVVVRGATRPSWLWSPRLTSCVVAGGNK